MTKPAFISCPKPKTYKDRRLLNMAKGRKPILLAPFGEQGDTVCCHGNWAAMGKGQGKKVHDFLTVWGSQAANMYLDQGRDMSKEERKTFFWGGMKEQVVRWEEISKGNDREGLATVLDMRSTEKALAHLKAWVIERSFMFEAGDWQLEWAR